MMVVGITTVSVAQEFTLIPDLAFETKLIQLGIDKDGQNGIVLSSSIDTVKSLDVSYQYNGEFMIDSVGILIVAKIKNLVGIENFTSLTNLKCNNNRISNLDLSKNTYLKTLSCNDNRISSVDLSNNIFLTNFSCQNNNLTTLDLSKNINLYDLFASFNKLTTLILNETVFNVYCSNNLLTKLDISKNSALGYLYCSNNQLTNLEISKSNNPNLQVLDCSFNQITSLNLRGISWVYLRCNDNQLSSLDLTDRHAYTMEWVLTYSVNCMNNPNLKVICVDKIADASASSTFTKDAVAKFSETCGNDITEITDNELISTISIAPNPSNGNFVVNVKENTTFLIRNTFGETVTTLALNEGTNNVSLNLETGVYIIQSQNSTGNSTQKLVIE